ncbi:MAG: redoxin domain-containing protein [Parachlamydiaceae bacterium]|nr:redoxin domain-containing protein [Parachlamydiaceae bacterium]
MIDLTHPVEVSAPAPLFTLPSNQYEAVHLADLTKEHNVLLFFMREFSCPSCRQTVSHLKSLHAELQAADVSTVIIGGGDRKYAEQLATLYKLPFPVLADLKREVYAQYGLHKVVKFNQQSGTYLIDKHGVLRYMRQATLAFQNFSARDLMEAVHQLGGKLEALPS